jgi:hypothetical protein
VPALKKDDIIFATRTVLKRRRVLEVRIVALFTDAFVWRGLGGGGIGQCRLADEGLTWTRSRGVELDAFRVAIEL